MSTAIFKFQYLIKFQFLSNKCSFGEHKWLFNILKIIDPKLLYHLNVKYT